MSQAHTSPSRTLSSGLLASVLLLSLTACSKSYVVLLPDDDGTLGKVMVTSPKDNALLEQKNQGAFIGGIRRDTFILSDQQLQAQFGAALAASPKKPARYLLYFDTGQTQLTEASQAEIPRIKDDISQRPGVDVAVIGHTDTQGEAQANYVLGLTRAQLVSQLIGEAGISADHVSIASHGEKNLLVATPDDTNEPRNRRVEVIVR